MSPRGKPAAALVAAITVLAVFSGAVAASPSGSEVGPAEAGSLSAGSTISQVADGDGDLRSAASFWAGWRLRFDAGPVLDGSASEESRTFEIWRVNEDGQLNRRVRTFTVDESGSHLVETGGLEGRYVLRYDGQPVYVHDGVGYLESPPDGSAVTVEGSAWRIDRQALTFDWSDPSIYPGETTTLTVRSDRDEYAIAVSGDGLSFEDLTRLFPASTYADDHDARAGQDVLLLEGGSSMRYRLDTAALTPGDRPITVDVVDTDTAGTAHLTVNAPAQDQRLRRIERTENVGDVVEAELVCDHCFVVVGGPGQGLLDVVELDDANGDGNVTLRINTRYAGMFTGAGGYPSGVAAYTSPDDDVTRYPQGATLERVEEDLITTTSTLNDLRGKLGLAGQGRVRPVEPGSIEVTVASTDFLVDRSDWGDRPPLGSQLVVRDATDAATVDLRPRSLDGIQPMAVPVEGSGELTGGQLGDLAAPRDRVALGDRLVFRIDASGVFGYLAGGDGGLDELLANREEGLFLRLHRLDEDGRQVEEMRLERMEARLLEDPETNSLYLTVRTGGASPSRLHAGRYRATLELRGIARTYDDYSTRGGHDGYPYLEPGASQSVSGTVTLADPEGSITAPEAGSSPRLNQDGELVLEGTTSVASGSSLTLIAASSEYAWEAQTTTTVESPRDWSAAIPLADAPGDTFTVTVYRAQERLAEQTYTVRPAAENGSSGSGSAGGDEAGGGSDGSSGGGADGGGEGESGLPIPGLADVTGLAVPVGGGVGALVVIWGSWRFVIRRLLL